MSVESYGFKFVVDAKDAAKGYGDFQRAVDGVFNSLAKFEQQAKKSLDTVTANSRKGQSDIAKYAAQFKALQNIPVDGNAAPKLLKLSEAMARFKAPNTTQITNMRNFFRTLGTLPDLNNTTRSIGNIAKLSAAMNGFKAPSAGQAEKLVAFAKALEKVGPGLASLSKVSGVSGIANELASVSLALRNLKIPSTSQAANLQNFARALQSMRIGGHGNLPQMLHSLSQMNGFKAPSAAQTRNLQQFVSAVNNLKVPPNASAISSHLQAIAAAANSANGSLKNFRGSLNGMNWGGFNAGAHKARLEMMGLQNAFSGTFQVGSLLRSLLGSLTIGELGREFFQATQSANQFHASMEVLGQSPMMQSSEWERVRADANKFGQDLLTFSDGFSKFAVAAHESGMSLGESFKVWEGFSTVSSAMHLGAEQQQSVGLAIREIMDQGYVSTSRLTRQLGLVLPGAMATLQKAWKESGKKGVSFFDALKQKMVDGKWALDTLSEHYKTVYGPALAAALESPIQQWNILKNNIHETMIEIGNDGAKKAFSDFIAKLSGGLDETHMHKFAQSISDGLVKALNKAGQAVDWLKKNWSSIKGPLGEAVSLLGKWMVISATLKIGTFIVSPLMSTYKTFMFLLPKMREFVTLMRASAALRIVPLGGGVGPTGPILGAQLTGGFATTLTAVNKLKSAMSGMNFGSVFTSIRSGFASLLTPIEGVGATIGAVTLSIAGGLVGAFASGAKAAHDSGIKMQSDQYTTGEIIRGLWIEVTNGIGTAFTKVGNWIGDVWDTVTTWVGKAMSAIGSIISETLLAITYGFQKMGEFITNLFVGLANSVGNTLKDMGATAGDLWHGNFSAVGSDAMKLMTADGVRRGFKEAFGNFSLNGADYANFKRNTGRGFAAVFDPILTHAGQLGRAANGKGKGGKPHPEVKPYEADAPAVTDPIYHGDGDEDGKKKKKKKGRDPNAALRSQENQISTLMKDLMEDDPYGKLFSDFVDKMTKEGEILLTNKAFKDYIKNIDADAATGKVSVDALVHALENGGIKGKVLDDLKKRYHTDVNGIIKMLYQQQNAYENSVKEATKKRIDADFKAANDVMKRLAEDNPILKLRQDYFDDLKNQAENLLNKDAYTTFMDDLTTHTYTTAEATQHLLELLKGVGNLAPNLAKTLNMQGVKLGDVTNGMSSSLRTEGLEELRKTHEQSIGGPTLDDLRQQTNLLSLNDKQQEIANKLLDEYNRQLGFHHTMTQQEIKDYQSQLIYWNKQIDYMKQMKDYYQNNGIQKYIEDLQTAGDFVHNFDSNILHNLEDTLYNLGTTGKLSFKGLIDGMQSDIIRFSSQQLTAKLVGFLKPNAMNEKDPTFGGIFGKMLGGTKGFVPKVERGTNALTPMYVSVVNGGLGLDFNGGGAGGGGLGSGLFGGSSSDTGNMSTMDMANELFGDNTDAMADPNKIGSPAGAVKDAITAGATASQSGIQQSFGSTFKGLAGSLGVMLGGALGSAIGGKAGGIIGTVASIGMMLLTHGGGGAPVPGALEGGITGSFVNSYRASPGAFVGAPHYAEGTANTSGGHPAILHDNEAVIPLSRGRKVPVELTGVSSPANSGTVVNNNFNISSPDADSFRKSKTQIATELHAAGARCWSRNNV